MLVYAANASVDKHEGSRTWLDSALSGREPVGLSWMALLAFLRLSTKVGLSPRRWRRAAPCPARPHPAQPSTSAGTGSPQRAWRAQR